MQSEALAVYDAAIYTTGVTHTDDQITVLVSSILLSLSGHRDKAHQ